MKKNYSSSLKKTSYKNVFYLALSILFASVIFYSCRKLDFNPNPLAENAMIKPSEIAQWFKELPAPLAVTGANSKDSLRQGGKLPFPLQWGKAQQRIINGKHIIRVPISKDAFMIFAKENVNAPLSAYVYKWENEKQPQKAFTGKVIFFSFQDYKMRGQVYKDGKGSNYITFKAKDEIDIEKIQTQKMSSNATTKSLLGDAFRLIGNVLGALGCTITGGTWDNGGGTVFDNYNGNFTDSCPDQWSFDWSAADGSSSGSVNSGSVSGTSTGTGAIFGTVYSNDYLININYGPAVTNGSNTSSGSSSSGSLTQSFWSIFSANLMYNAYYSNSSQYSGTGSYSSPVDLFSASLGGLSDNETNWLNSRTAIFDALKSYVINSPLSISERKEFISWSIVYLDSNPTVTLEEFKNHFMIRPEGSDGEVNSFDPDFWNDVNLTVPPQTLPSYQDFYSAYPKGKTANQIFQLIGGSLLNSHNANPANYSNACALRVSRALNYSGITIPVYFNAITGKQVTQKGGDNKNYFLDAKNLNVWLRRTFGNPTYHFTKAQGGTNGQNFPGLLRGKKGIFSMVSDRPSWASGHGDLFDGNMCDSGCHFDGPVDYIDIWGLQ